MSRGLLGLLMALLVAIGGGGAVVLGGDGGSGTDRPGSNGRTGSNGDAPGRVAEDPENCRRTSRVVDVGISGTRYPEVRRHWERAIRDGHPRVLTINRAGASERRRILLRGIPTRSGDDRDEYPPAMARARPAADVAYVDSAQNRGAGSVQGVKLRRWCSGQRFRVVWY